MKLTNYRIGARLVAAFGLVVLLSVGSASVALLNVAAIQRNLDDVVIDNNVRIKLTHEMAESVHVVSRVMRTMVLLHEKSEMQTEEAKLLKARERYDAAWAGLQKLPVSDAGKAIRDKIAAAARTAREQNNGVIDLAHAGRDGEAITKLLKQAGPATQIWQDLLDEYVAYQEANTEKQHQQAVADYEQARSVLIGANAMTIVLAVLLGWLITRSIAGPMKRAAYAASQMAEGDLTVELNADGKDETAQLLRALAEMRSNLQRIVGGVRQAADSVATASSQIAQGNLDLSQRTEEQASALQETAASMCHAKCMLGTKGAVVSEIRCRTWGDFAVRLGSRRAAGLPHLGTAHAPAPALAKRLVTPSAEFDLGPANRSSPLTFLPTTTTWRPLIPTCGPMATGSTPEGQARARRPGVRGLQQACTR